MRSQNKELTNIEIVTIAVFQKNGAMTYVDVEDIAIESFGLAPTKFCWKKYPEYIDKSVVLFALNDVMKMQKPYLEGSIRKGYMLTKEGLNYVNCSLDKFGNLDIAKSIRKDSIEFNYENERERLRKTSAYQKSISQKSDLITEREFNDFAKINDYFPTHLKKKRFSIIDNSIGNDDDLKKLWDFLKNKFLEV